MNNILSDFLKVTHTFTPQQFTALLIAQATTSWAARSVMLKVWSTVNSKKAEVKAAEMRVALSKFIKEDYIGRIDSEQSFIRFNHLADCLAESMLASEQIMTDIKQEDSNYKDLPSLLFNRNTQLVIIGKDSMSLVQPLISNQLLTLAPPQFASVGMLGEMKVESLLKGVTGAEPTNVLVITDSSYYAPAYGGFIQVGIGTELDFTLTDAILDDEGADIEYDIYSMFANCTRINLAAPSLILT